MVVLPMEGLRVIDATTSWAGAYLTNMMGTFGAQVIKIEAIQRLDLWRAAGTFLLSPREKLWEWSPAWNAVNTNKLELTINLTNPKGVDIFKKLAKISDVIAENFTPRVMDNFGLGYNTLQQDNTGLVMISLPAHGGTGPWKDLPGFAHPIEMMSGLAQLMGYPDGPPRICGTGITDPIAGTNGFIAVLFALLYRQTMGMGQHIDLSQVEAATCLIGDAIADYSVNKRVQQRQANDHRFMAPHGYYRCKGDEMWVGIAVATDSEWDGFCRAIGSPSWTSDERFSTSLARWNHRRELDVLVEGWTVGHDHYHVMNMMQKVGVAAGPYLTSAELLTDPHVNARGVFQRVDRALVGTHPYPVPTTPMRLSNAPASIMRPAPLLGEHNNYVLGELLGLSSTEIKLLEDERVIGTVPIGA
ncbi:MAG: CoA transferase [Dehalococcoidia bacterium]|nr:CoA transferase [Dehalococcoidia bacterium]